jgi:uncharacterized protein (DUF1330 family)
VSRKPTKARRSARRRVFVAASADSSPAAYRVRASLETQAMIMMTLSLLRRAGGGQRALLDQLIHVARHVMHRLAEVRAVGDTWSGIGHLAVGMARQGYDLQLTRYDEKAWRATFYRTGMTSATGTHDESWEVLKGAAPNVTHITMIEFPSMERARAWYNDPEYAPMKRLRQAAGRVASSRISNTVGHPAHRRTRASSTPGHVLTVRAAVSRPWQWYGRSVRPIDLGRPRFLFSDGPRG